MTAIHSSASFASISPAGTGEISGRPVTQAPPAGSFLALMRNSSAGQTPDEATATPGSPKKDAIAKDASPKGPGNQLDTTALPLVNLPVQPNSNSPFRLRFALSSATDQSGSDAEAAANNGANGDSSSVITDGDTNPYTKNPSLNALLSQTILSPAVTSNTVGNQLLAKAASLATSSRVTSSSAKATAPNPAQALAGKLSASAGVARFQTNLVDQTASTLKASNQTTLTQPDTPQATSGQPPVSAQPPVASDSAAVSEGRSPLQTEITSSTDGPRVEVSTTPTGDPGGELAFALRMRDTEPAASSDPVNDTPSSGKLLPTNPGGATLQPGIQPAVRLHSLSNVRFTQAPAADSASAPDAGDTHPVSETPDSGGSTPGTLGATLPRTGFSMLEPASSESATKPETQLNSPASARPAHTSEGAAPSQSNGRTLSSDTGSGTDHNNDRDSHLPGNSQAAASSNPEPTEPQRITAAADLTSIHGQGVMATGTIPGGPDMSATTAPKAPTAASASPAAPSSTAPVAEDNPAVGPAQQISLSVSSGNNDQKVEIRLMERAGEILVSVRTPDQTLAHSLRDDLGSLTGKLNQSGYSTEAFAPPGSASSNLSDRGAGKQGASEDRESNGGQRQNSGQRGTGDEQQSQQEGRGKRPAWLEELNHSMASRQPNRSNSWQHP